MNNRHEQVIYENDRNFKIILKRSFPFFLNAIKGTDGTSANISQTAGTDQDGSAITNVTLKERPIEIEGTIQGDSKDALGHMRSELLRIFNPKIQGWLQYEYGGIKKKIRCQVEDAPIFSKITSSFKTQSFIIFLTAPNPYWQDVNESVSQLALQKGLFEFPLEIVPEGIELGTRISNLIAEINNKGDVSTGLKIAFKAQASVVNPSLLNIYTREFVKIEKTLEAGEELVITTHFRNKRVILKKDGIESNGFNYINEESTFLQLDIGRNVFRYDAESGLENLQLDIFYTPQYLGV